MQLVAEEEGVRADAHFRRRRLCEFGLPADLHAHDRPAQEPGPEKNAAEDYRGAAVEKGHHHNGDQHDGAHDF